MTIREIEEALAKLPRQKLVAFRAWFYKFDARIWDKQFEEDAKSSKLDDVADKAIDDFENDRCKELSGISPAHPSGNSTTSSPKTSKEYQIKSSICKKDSQSPVLTSQESRKILVCASQHETPGAGSGT